MGAKIVGISDAYGALHDPEGLDIDYLLDRRDSFGTVTNLSNRYLNLQDRVTHHKHQKYRQF